jgi:uncharacterized cupredoxin-like copper-binding protein
LLTACGGQPADTEPEGGSGGATTVAVRLQEWAVVPAQESAPAGGVKFALENKGEETHEFVVIQTDLGARELPTAKDGSVEEEGSGMQVVDEVEDIPSGNSATLTVSLDPGNYVLLCNIVEEKENESHYQMGMSTEFSVE